MVTVNPQIYYDAAKKLTDIGTDIDTATTTLVKALWETGAMSGTSDAAEEWAKSYDTRASSTIDNARRLAQSLPYFASLVALAGYNHALADYNADIKPHKGAAPTKPATVTAPIPLSWASAPSAGGPGNGLVSIAALTERIHVHIPDGDTDKLGTAAKAWNAFLNTPAIDNAGSRISDVASALRQNQAHETADLDDLVMMLSGSAYKIYAGAKNLATDCDKHKQALVQLRNQIKGAIDDLEAATALTLIATIFADVITAGVGVIVDAATLAAYGFYFDEAATAITGFVEAIDLDRLLTIFSKEEDAAATISRDLDEIDSLTPQEIESEEAAGDYTPEAGVQADAQTTESVEKKLDAYLLNLDHPAGGPKAKWFQQALGFTRANQSELASQIVFNPANATETAVTQFGTKYNQIIPITGANGKVIDVTFAWIRNNDGVVRLVTAIPTPK
ncbi:DUF6883 domain-containing protein [Nocardia miyunensis]|uniref:DUF6883 domain-containing protein n=1 Tax=Nocardia miyunensis TaxID=282684 RepID=UPI00082F01CC|nr:DUF6883 domain-containing protein [Nocardia miyunensis]